MIRTIIFDIDNVLIRCPWASWAEAKFGREKADRLERIFRGTGYLEELEKGSWKIVHFMAKCMEYAPECEEEIRAFLAGMGECPEKCAYAIPWVEELKSLGYRVLYLANSSYILRRLCPEVLDFLPHMDGGLFSCDVGMVKPDAGIYARICGEYDLDPAECLFLDDEEGNLAAARAYGMNTLQFDEYEACYPLVMDLLARSRAGRPRIGVTCSADMGAAAAGPGTEDRGERGEDPGRKWQEDCLQWIREAGGEPMLLPFTGDPKEILRYTRLCDGFLFSGGEDVDPGVYGQPVRIPEEYLNICRARDHMEEALLDLILGQDKPVLGIGRGMQLINAALCGELWQDLTWERAGGPERREAQAHGDDSSEPRLHPVRILRGTPLRELLARDSMEVNSCHHQGVKELSRFLREMAVAPDGLCEALWMPGQRFVWGVQWHPEQIRERSSGGAEAGSGGREEVSHSKKIARALVEACRL